MRESNHTPVLFSHNAVLQCHSKCDALSLDDIEGLVGTVLAHTMEGSPSENFHHHHHHRPHNVHHHSDHPSQHRTSLVTLAQELRVVFDDMRERLVKRSRPPPRHDGPGPRSLGESRECLWDALDALQTCLMASDQNTLPSQLVYRLHTYIGLLHLYLGQTLAARTTLVKALWVATKNQATTGHMTEPYAVAQSLHRLGIAYAVEGDVSKTITMSTDRAAATTQQAKHLLERALLEYDKASLLMQKHCRLGQLLQHTVYRESVATILRLLPHVDEGDHTNHSDEDLASNENTSSTANATRSESHVVATTVSTTMARLVPRWVPHAMQRKNAVP